MSSPLESSRPTSPRAAPGFAAASFPESTPLDTFDASIGVPRGVATPAGEFDELAARVLDVLRRRRLTVVLTPLLCAAIVVSLVVAGGRWWTAGAAFTPSSSDANTKQPLASLAAQFGVSVGSAGASQSPAFYADLLRARPIVAAVVDSQYDVLTERGRVRGTLADVLHLEPTAPAMREDAAVRALLNMLAVATKRETGVVTFSVRSRYPQLSASLANRLLAEVDRFNQNSRQTQAKAQRRFAEARLTDAKTELRNAEDRLQRYEDANQVMRQGSALALQAERLAADVETRRAVVTSLSQAFEQARIDEVRDTPAITVVEPANVPLYPDPRGLVRSTLLALTLGLALGVALAFGLEWARQLRLHSP